MGMAQLSLTPIRTGLFGAVGINRQRMVSNGKALAPGYFMLALFDLDVVKLFYLATIKTHQMVMVLAFVELKHRLAGFKITAEQQPSLLKLGQNPVNRSQTHVGAIVQQHPKHVFSGHVALLARLKNFQYFQSGQGCFEAGTFQLFDVAHGFFRGKKTGVRTPVCSRPSKNSQTLQ